MKKTAIFALALTLLFGFSVMVLGNPTSEVPVNVDFDAVVSIDPDVNTANMNNNVTIDQAFLENNSENYNLGPAKFSVYAITDWQVKVSSLSGGNSDWYNLLELKNSSDDWTNVSNKPVLASGGHNLGDATPTFQTGFRLRFNGVYDWNTNNSADMTVNCTVSDTST